METVTELVAEMRVWVTFIEVVRVWDDDATRGVLVPNSDSVPDVMEVVVSLYDADGVGAVIVEVCVGVIFRVAVAVRVYGDGVVDSVI